MSAEMIWATGNSRYLVLADPISHAGLGSVGPISHQEGDALLLVASAEADVVQPAEVARGAA